MKIASFFFVWAFIIAALTGNTVYAQAPPYAGALSGGSGGGVPASAASLNLANYLTSTQLTTAQAGVNTQDLTTQITTWLAACPATGCQYVVPPGYFYSATCNFSIPNPFTMFGAGTRNLDGTAWGSVIACGANAVPLFTITALQGRFEDLAMLYTPVATATAGSSAVIVTSSDLNQAVSYDNVQFDGFYDTVDIRVGQGWHLSYSVIQNSVHYGVRIQNTVNNDAGENFVDHNEFFPLSGSTAIRFESSGGTQFLYNEFGPNNGGHLISCIDMTSTGGSIETVIQGNVCEQTGGPPIAIYVGWRLINIVGNQLNIHGADGVATFTAAIAGNVMTVTAPTGTIYAGMSVTGTGIPKGAWIKPFGSGGTTGVGGVGTYQLNLSLQSAPSGISATANTPAILCALCTATTISGNTLEMGNAGGPAIILDNSLSVTVSSNQLVNATTPLWLSNLTNVNYSGTQSFSLANQPDPTKVAIGSTSNVNDATSPVLGQPFTGGGKFSVPIYADGARWIAATTVLAANYFGPGDLKPGAVIWWGLQAYNAATAGTKAALICNAADANCVDINTLANGQFDLASAQAAPLNCTPGTCTIQKFYNKAGANCTTDTTCDLVQATIALRPVLTWNTVGSAAGLGQCQNAVTGIGNLPCAFNNRGAVQAMATVGTLAVNQPFTLVALAARQTGFAFYRALISNAAGSVALYSSNTANNVNFFSTTDHNLACTDFQWHAMMAISIAGASASSVTCDSATSTFTATLNFQAAAVVRGLSDPGDNYDGVVTELGIWPVGFSPTDVTNMTNNMRARYSYGN